VHAANGAHLSDMTGRAARMALGGQCGFGMRLPRRRDDACMRARRYRHRPSGRQRAALHLHGAGARPRYMHRGQDHSAHVSDRRLRNEQLYRNDAPQLPQTASKSAVSALHHSARPSAASGLAHLRAAPLVAAAEAIWSGPCLELGSVAIAISVIRKSLVTPRLSCVSTLFDCPALALQLVPPRVCIRTAVPLPAS
jgi:hypothetical protein